MSSAGLKNSSAAGNGSEAVFWQIEELLNCMICFESFRSPKMLKCGHTFCTDCLQGYHATYEQQRRAVPGKLPCPTCRELTTLPPGGVAALRNDFKVQKIEDLFRTMNVRQQNHHQKTPQQQQQLQQPVSRQSTELCAPCQAQNKKTMVC